MSLTDEQEERFRLYIHALDDARTGLSDWERNFLDDQIKRYDQYGPKVTLSPKQWAVLDKMYDKITGEPG